MELKRKDRQLWSTEMAEEKEEQDGGVRPRGRPRVFGSKGDKYTHTYTVAVAYRKEEHQTIKQIASGLNMNTSAFIRMCVRYCLNTPSVCAMLRTLGSIGEVGMDVGGRARALPVAGYEGSGGDDLYNTKNDVV